MSELAVMRCGPGDIAEATSLRAALWPNDAAAAHHDALRSLLAHPERLVLLARFGSAAAGYAEASIRHDHVNGCDTSPVAFLEGVFVAPARRRTGIARALLAGVADWPRQHGMTEIASDADIANGASHRMHHALGFTETERVVFFRQPL